MIVDTNFVLKHYFKVHCSEDRTLIVDSLEDFKNIPIVAEEVYEFTKTINILPILKEDAEDINAMMSMYMDVLTRHSDRCDQVINKFKVKEDNNDVTG